MDDIQIRFIDLPCTVKGVTVQDANGFYNVYINARLSEYAQKEAIHHEIAHIKRNDFYSLKSINAVETM